jgi:hypothetical protein
MVNFVKNFAIQGGKKAQDMKFVHIGNEHMRYPPERKLDPWRWIRIQD